MGTAGAEEGIGRQGGRVGNTIVRGTIHQLSSEAMMTVPCPGPRLQSLQRVAFT